MDGWMKILLDGTASRVWMRVRTAMEETFDPAAAAELCKSAPVVVVVAFVVAAAAGWKIADGVPRTEVEPRPVALGWMDGWDGWMESISG